MSSFSSSIEMEIVQHFLLEGGRIVEKWRVTDNGYGVSFCGVANILKKTKF